MDTFDHIPEQAMNWIAQGKKVALANVIQTWGSAPRPAGSQLAISSQTELSGSVSGGCVEAAVAAEALIALEDGEPRVVEYGVSDDEAFAVGLACGGTIRILVEPIGVGNGPKPEMIADLVEARRARRPVAYCVNISTWDRRLESPDGASADMVSRFTSGKSGIDGDWYVGIHNPPLRLIVVGAAHIAQPLVQMARLAGYDSVLVDPRSAFLTADRFPGERLVDTWPDEALAAEGLDAGTAVVTLSHDPKIDDPAIAMAIKSDVFYLGCLGSKKTHAKRAKRLSEAGFGDDPGDFHADLPFRSRRQFT